MHALALVFALTLGDGDADALIAKLGSDSVDEREAATQSLIKLGRPVAELVKPLMNSSDPEIAARAKMVYDAVTRVAWLGSVEAAQASAKADGKLTMVLVAMSPTPNLAMTNRDSFGDAWLVDYLRDHFACAWVSRPGGPSSDFGLAGEAVQVQEPTYDHVILFADADGKVVHMVYGALGSPEDLLDEAKFAKAVAVKLAEGKKDEVAAMHQEHLKKHADAPAAGGLAADWRRQAFQVTHSNGLAYLERPLAQTVDQFLNPRIKG